MRAPDDQEDDDPVAICNRLLSSLASEIPRALHFKPKWSLLRSHLCLLPSLLPDLSPHHPLSLDLLRSISHSLRRSLSLALKCQLPSLPDGKLHTQSDLDSSLSLLLRHLHDCDVLLKSGLLLLLPPDPSTSSSSALLSKRESVRVQSRDLVTRLQIGAPDSKNFALDSLSALLAEDDKNVIIAVAQGVVPVLVKLLDSGSLEVREKAVAALSRVSTVNSSKPVLIAEGLLLLNHLLRVLESGSGFAKEKACVALQALSYSKENARALGTRGGVSSLLEICVAGTPSSQASAAGVLRNLATFPEIKENFMEENAVVVLLGLASSGTALAQENAIGCLCNLIAGDSDLKLTVVRDKGIECLKNYWDSAPSERSLEVAVELLGQLASCQPIGEALVSEGFIARLLSVLDCGVLGVRIAAARAVCELGFSPKTKKEIGECGCIAALIKMLDGKAVEEKEAAAKALSNLLLYAGNRKIFRKDAKGVTSAVLLLDPSIQNLDKRYPVSILTSLAHSKKCRKQMVTGGACANLQKLVEMDVEGAKKLYDSISRGKIWDVFTRP
ncbi:uncharacterized protein LOC115661542 [Syzygium oleosum]|uniref:uncharacterized protein LOC115661542 n=1 Tax=Syzygium oleosum TaxID=219896 RepID=UPI0024BA7FBD|nr:uncharacterized protein LOC115661542 [Syzygium oleosum]